MKMTKLDKFLPAPTWFVHYVDDVARGDPNAVKTSTRHEAFTRQDLRAAFLSGMEEAAKTCCGVSGDTYLLEAISWDTVAGCMRAIRVHAEELTKYWQGHEVGEVEPLGKVIPVWEITPHPSDASIDSCIERDYARAV